MSLWNKIKHYPKLGLVILVYVAFISLGMPDGLLGVAWPSIRADFSIPLDAIGMLLPLTVAGYITSAFLSGPWIARWGIGRVLAASCAMTGTALIGYTLVPSWWMMVLLGALAGLGAGAIDAGLNSYAAANFGEGLMQWLHASYGIGVTLGPLIMTLALSTWNSWRLGYRTVGGFQIALALCFVLSLPLWVRQETPKSEDEPRKLTDYKTPLSLTLRQPRVWLSLSLFFLYCGAEVSLGTWTYSLLTESRHIDASLAGLVTGSFWATFTLGRVVAGVYARRIGIDRMVLWAVSFALGGAILLFWNPSGIVSLLAVTLIGFAIAPIFAALMSGTSERVGIEYAANTIGMQMSAVGLGTALIPSLLGVLARRLSLEVIPVCLVVTFALLLVIYRLSMQARKV